MNMTTTIRKGDVLTDALSAGNTATITSTGSALVELLKGQDLVSKVSVSSSLALGPYLCEMQVRITPISGEATYTESAENYPLARINSAGNGFVDAAGADLRVVRQSTSGALVGADGAVIPVAQAGGAPLPTICLFGDSYAIYDSYTSTGLVSAQASLWRCLLAKCGGHRIAVTNAGVGGNTAALMRARLDTDVLAGASSIVLGNCGANDFFGTTMATATDVLADVLYMIDAIAATGRRVLWANAPVQATTRTNWSLTRQKEALKYNDLLARAALSRPSLVVLDLAGCMLDPADVTNFAPLATMISVSDGIHLSYSASVRFAERNYLTLDKLLPTVARRFSQADAYTESWSDSLLPAGVGQMAGSGGTAGTNTTGTIPTGWTASGTAQSAVVGSIITDVGGNWFELAATVSGESTVRQCSFSTASFHSRVAVGDTLRLMFEIEIEPGTADVTGVIGRIYTYDGSAIQSTSWGDVLNGEQALSLSGTTHRSLPITVPVTLTGGAKTAAQVYFYLRLKGTGTAKLRVRNVKPYKV